MSHVHPLGEARNRYRLMVGSCDNRYVLPLARQRFDRAGGSKCLFWKGGSVPTPAERRGLFRLMSKWPEMRPQLADCGSSDPDFISLCELYDEACAALENWRRSPAAVAPARIAEYEQLVSDLEIDVRSAALVEKK
jgi:hypothetical protein